MKDSAVERGRRGPDIDVSMLLGTDHEEFEAASRASGTGRLPLWVITSPDAGPS